MKALTFPLDRQGTLYVDGVQHSTGLFHADKKAGLYVSSIDRSLDIPPGVNIVLNADDGANIEIERIYKCPVGEPHHHFKIDL